MIDSDVPDIWGDRPLEEFFKEEDEMIEAIEKLEIEDVMENPYLDINKLPSRIAFNKIKCS